MTTWRDQKKRYKQYKARKDQLPASYLTAVEAVERYALHFGPGTAETLMPMLEDLIGLFETGAAADEPIQAIVGDDPVQFVEGFLRNYPTNAWTGAERQRLTDAITRSANTGNREEAS